MTQKMPALEFCLGPEDHHLSPRSSFYAGWKQNSQLGEALQSIVLVGSFCLIILEFCIYAVIFIDHLVHNQSLSAEISKDVLQRRHRYDKDFIIVM